MATTLSDKQINSTIPSPVGEVQYDTKQQTVVESAKQEAEVQPVIKLECDDNFFSCPTATCCYMTIRRQTMMEHLLHHSLRYHCRLCTNRYSFLASAKAHWAKDHADIRLTPNHFCAATQSMKHWWRKFFRSALRKQSSNSK